MLPIRPKQKSGSRNRKLLKARNEEKEKMAKFMIDFTQKVEYANNEHSRNSCEIDDSSIEKNWWEKQVFD